MMKFNPRAKIDRSQVQDRRGQGGRRGGGMSGLPGLGRGGGTGGFPIPTGGGIGGIIIFIIIVVLGLVFGGNVLGVPTGRWIVVIFRHGQDWWHVKANGTVDSTPGGQGVPYDAPRTLAAW